MPLDIIISVFGLFFVASYLLLNRGLGNIICGFVLLSNGVNLFILAASGNPAGKSAPIIGDGTLADPLPQAMILTAIVIGLGMLAFLAALIYKVYKIEGTEDTRSFMGRKK